MRSVISLAFVILITEAQSQWIPCGSPEEGSVASTLIGHQSGSNALFASTASHQIFYTLDDATTWDELTNHTYRIIPGLPEFNRLSMIGDIFLADTDSGYFSSCNYGFDWHNGYPGFNNVINNNGIWYASTGYNLYKSVDEGTSWNVIFQTPAAGSLRLLEAKNNIILATAYAQAGQPPNQYMISWLIKSVDGGKIFTSEIINGYMGWYRMNIVGTNVFYVAGNEYLYVSNDTAKNFHQDSTFLNSRIAAIHPYKENFVFISSYDSSIFFSQNMGSSWVNITDDFKGRAKTLYLYGKYLYAIEGSSNIWKRNVSNLFPEPPTPNNDIPGLQIYPVPSTGVIQIKLPADYFDVKSYEIKVCDIMGRAVFRTSADFWGESVELNLQQLSKGVYIISLSNNNTTFKGKLIIE